MIAKFTFGTITVGSQRYHNDIKIIDGEVVADWWRDSGHTVDFVDILDILQRKPDMIVIGKGDPGYMRVADGLREYVENHKIELIEEKTPTAIDTFNRLFHEGRKVAGAFHVGC